MSVALIVGAGPVGLTNPTSGFGLTGGIYDSFLLSEALAAVVHEQASHEILDRYSESRRKVYLEVTSPVSTESFRLVFHSGDQDRLSTDLALLRNRKERSRGDAQVLVRSRSAEDAFAGDRAPAGVDGRAPVNGMGA